MLICQILTLMLLAYLIIQAVKSFKQTIYSYKNAALLGAILFIIPIFISTFFYGVPSPLQMAYRFGLIYSLGIFIPAILISISNISLIFHEGKSYKNLLGIFLGFGIILGCVAVTVGWQLVYEHVIFPIYLKGYKWITVPDIAIPGFISLLLCYLECFLNGCIICGYVAAKHIPQYDKDYIIILGCGLDEDGKPLRLLRKRIDAAIEFGKKQYENTGKTIKYVGSGGQGSDEIIAEGESIKNYLMSKGISEEDILVENKSVNTMENMRFSKTLIDQQMENAKVAYATTNFHVYRSGIYGKEVGLDCEGVASSTKWYYWPNGFVREYVALLFNTKKIHLQVLVVLLIDAIIEGVYIYFYV